MRYIWRDGNRFYHYDNYKSWNDALKVARYYKKKKKSKYFIVKYESGFIFPEMRYALYLNNVFKLFT